MKKTKCCITFYEGGMIEAIEVQDLTATIPDRWWKMNEHIVCIRLHVQAKVMVLYRGG